MAIDRRSFIQAGAAAAAGVGLAGAGSALAQPALRRFTPEMFGAAGDGRTNDTKAFARMAEAVSSHGSGLVEFRRGTYIVGEQYPSLTPPHSFIGAKLAEFVGCTGPLVIRGNGARIKCADRLRYGTFDVRTDTPTHHPVPFLGAEMAFPYRSMIKVERCSGPIEVSDLEFDGNVDRLRIGGPYGDLGHQIPAIGLVLANNSGPEIVRDIYSHHHGQDGFLIDGLDRVPPAPVQRRITRLRSEYNGRQGCSIVGGRGYLFEQCQFNHTGRAAVGSAPGAGVDIEAEGGKLNRDFTFVDCEFIDNLGIGMVADTGDSEGAQFTRCTFIGTTAWSAWPFKPRFRFDKCSFVGSLVRAHGDPDPARAAQFHDCTFRDDPRLSPNDKVYLGGKAEGWIADLSNSANMLFNRCRFLLTHGGLLPWSWHAIYSDCVMQQKSTSLSYPKGTYIGHSTLTGHVDLYGTTVAGTLVANGRTYNKVKLAD